MKERDKIHYTTRAIDGYNLPFNFIISEREAGKSTAIWLDKCYKAFKESGKTSLVVRRKVVHITEAYINDIAKIINKFTDDKVQFIFNKGNIKDGIIDVYLNHGEDEKKLFIRIIALSIDITAGKSLMLENLQYIIFDEFICNARFGEKYLKNECFKFMEIYNTFRRECENIKCYFLGNPYSLANPYFIFFNIPVAKIKRGSIFSDKKSYCVEAYEITQELREYILSVNPLYQFDNSYTKYAFEGQNINDANIMIMEEIPDGYRLAYVFKCENKFIGVFQNEFYIDGDNKYYCKFLEQEFISKRRDIYAFDFDELVEQTIILSNEERYKFQKIKDAMRRRLIYFQNINVYYIFEEIYYNL